MSLAAQRKVGVASSALVIVAALAFIALLDVDTFTGWVSFLALSCTPVQVVLAVHWSHDLPPALSRQPRLVRGGTLLAITLAVGTVAALFFEATVGGGNGSHFPPLVMFSIVAIVTSFWLAIVFGGWPFVLLKNKVAMLGALLVACYAVAYFLFRALFDFSFLRGTPIYVENLDPGGAFNAWNALTFLVTAITGMFLVRSFDFWTFGRTTQPVRGVFWTLACLIWGTALFSLGVGLLDIDPVTFLVRVPIPLLFGGLIVLNVLRGSLYATVKQPLKGVLNVATSMAVGSVLVMLYQALSPPISGALPGGPPAYGLEIWLASATLGITFPLLILQTDFLDFWPFAAPKARPGEPGRDGTSDHSAATEVTLRDGKGEPRAEL